mmetsp:Transcript_49166/g.137724  ORF Transcript_49166/g.137724 Transcript_49166/m.137724 type:complete len:206 (-) Transcript_49166:295-912(-)
MSLSTRRFIRQAALRHGGATRRESASMPATQLLEVRAACPIETSTDRAPGCLQHPGASGQTRLGQIQVFLICFGRAGSGLAHLLVAGSLGCLRLGAKRLCASGLGLSHQRRMRLLQPCSLCLQVFAGLGSWTWSRSANGFWQGEPAEISVMLPRWLGQAAFGNCAKRRRRQALRHLRSSSMCGRVLHVGPSVRRNSIGVTAHAGQ